MNCQDKTEEVSPADIAAVEAALRHLDAQHRNKQVLGQIAQWFLVLKIYKEIEKNLIKTRGKTSFTLSPAHRAILASVMGFGEILLNQSSGISDESFALIACSRETLEANVKYLRDKYEQWFVKIDEQEVHRVWSQLNNEHEGCTAEDMSAKI